MKSNRIIEFETVAMYTNGKWYKGEELKALLQQRENERIARDIAIQANKKEFPNFTKTLIKRNYGIHTYKVSGTDGMTDFDIINQCDPNNFGGKIYGSTVDIYVD